MAPKRRPPEERFWEKVDKNAPNGCWIWTGGLTRYDLSRIHQLRYGLFFLNERDRLVVRAHRWSWEHTHGPIPENMFVLHTCDNPPCVRPDHLFLGTPLDNMRDMIAKGRQQHPAGEHHQRAKVTWEQVHEMRRRRAGGELVGSLAREYGLEESTASRLLRGLTWKV